MIEIGHRQHGSPSFRPSTSSTSSPSSSRPAADLAPLPVRHLKAPPSPLVNNFTSSSFPEDDSTDGTAVITSSTAGNDQKSKVIRAEKDKTESDKSGHSVLNLANGKQQQGLFGRTSGRSSGSSSSSSSSSSKTHLSVLLPGMSAASEQEQPLVHRIRRGQRWEEFQPFAPAELPPLHVIDSAFQLQEYLALLIRHDPHNVDKIVELPRYGADSSLGESEKGKGKDIDTGVFGSMDDEPMAVDTDVWIYEQLRRIVLDFTAPWLTTLQKECDKSKRPKSCEAMNADDWMYLCASHGEEKQCCAIDYIIHTLDGTTALLNTQRHFPSRTYIPTTSLRHFGSVSRRLSRIFVHAFEHHRDVFEACEAETSLYARFINLVETFDLIAIESLPQLGSIGKGREEEQKSVSSETGISEYKQRHGGGANTNEESATSVQDKGDMSRGSVRGTLFDAGESTTPEGDGLDLEDISLSSDEPLKGSSLERSDSSASRVTAIHVQSPNRSGRKEVKAESGEDVSTNRNQKEVPQDVNDEEEESEDVTGGEEEEEEL